MTTPVICLDCWNRLEFCACSEEVQLVLSCPSSEDANIETLDFYFGGDDG